MMRTCLIQTMLYAFLDRANRGSWWDIIKPELRLIFSLALFFVNLLVLAVVLYLAGLAVVGGKRVLLTDAFIISLLGTVLTTMFFLFIPYGIIALLLSVFTWLLLIKRLYETRWLGAIAVGILAIIIFLAITILLALIFGILHIIIERLLSFTILML